MFLPTNKFSDIIRYMKGELKGLYEEEEIRSFAFILFEEYCGLKKTEVLANPDKGITESEMLKVHFAIKDLKKCKPVQQIIGKAWFCGMGLKVSQDVLIPRPETEEFVEWIISDLKHTPKEEKIRMLDIGTGSGCIAVALAKSLFNATVSAVDISDAALDIARENASLNSCFVEFEKMDILNEKEYYKFKPFDIIVSNPPYVRISEKKQMKKNVLDFEPANALFVPDDDPLIFYRKILEFAFLKLIPGGSIYFELNETTGEDALQLGIDNGYNNSVLRKDINGKNRMLRCRG